MQTKYMYRIEYGRQVQYLNCKISLAFINFKMLGVQQGSLDSDEQEQGESSGKIGRVALEDQRIDSELSGLPTIKSSEKKRKNKFLTCKKVIALLVFVLLMILGLSLLSFKEKAAAQKQQGSPISSTQIPTKPEVTTKSKQNQSKNKQNFSQIQTQSSQKPSQTVPEKTNSIQAIKNTAQTIETEAEPKDEEQGLLSQQYLFDCQRQEPIFHYFNNQQKTLYYRTPYQLFFPSCVRQRQTKIGLKQVTSWFQSRQIIQWSRRYVKKGDIMLLDCPRCSNFLQIVMLSKFIGKEGRLHLITEIEEIACFQRIRSLHNINNVELVARNSGMYKKYQTVITLNQNFLKDEVKEGLWQSSTVRVFAKFNQSIVKEFRKMGQFQGKKKVSVRKVSLNSSNCTSVIKQEKVDYEAGFYQFFHEQQPKIQPINQTQNNQTETETPFLRELRKKYEEFKKTLPPPSQRKDISKIVENFPVSSKVLLSNREQEVQVEVIQWIKNRTKSNSIIFLQQKTQNLLTLLNVAALLPQGKLLLRTQNSGWEIVNRYIERLNIKNIQRDQSNQNAFPTAQLFITDNKATIQMLAAANLKQGILLAFFDESIEGSKELLYKLYAKFTIQRVTIIPSFYFGYQIFDHFLWSSEHPKGFFQIQKQQYVIFQFWNQDIDSMSVNRKFSINQIRRFNTPEVKVITPWLRPYFILPEVPLHKAFEHLTPVHKADYLRCYFMHHIGGGYSDIKHLHFDFLPYLQKVFQGPQDKYAAGYHQISPGDIACHDQPGQSICDKIKPNYMKIFGNGLYIFKKGSPITTYWFTKAQQILDRKYEDLIANKYLNIRDAYGKTWTIDGRQVRSKYPLRWGELHGQILAKAQWASFEHYYVDMPYVIPVDYK